jgi:hypothetical protein
VDLDAAMAHADGVCAWEFAPAGSAASSAAAWAKKTDGIVVAGTGGLPSLGGGSSCDPAHLTNADVPEDAGLIKLVEAEKRRSGGVHAPAWEELREAGCFRVPRNSAGLLVPTAAQRDAAGNVFYCVVSAMAFDARAEIIELPWCKRHRPADRAKATWFLDNLAKKAKGDADTAPANCPCHCGATVAPAEVGAWRKAVAGARANTELRAALQALHLVPPLHTVTLGEGTALEAAEAAAAAAKGAKGKGGGKGAGAGAGSDDKGDDDDL